MEWQEIEDDLFDGTIEEMNKIICPECRGNIRFEYNEGNFKIECISCHTTVKMYKAPIPNCVEHFGNEYTIGK